MSVKHVVVTGANGFIGQHLCRKLVESGRHVTACVREGADASVFSNLAPSLSLNRLPSLGFKADLSQLFRNADVVLHLAGRAHVMQESAEEPLAEFRRVNVEGTETLASIAAQTGVKRFIYLSSIKVNGEATNGRAFRADDLPGYCDPYGQSKWEAEERLCQIAKPTAMEWVIVRPPLVYGPQVPGNFRALMRCAFRGIPLPVGSLHNSRSLVSVYNLCDLLSLLIDHPAAANSRFLVSDAEDVSTPELVRRIAAGIRRPPRIIPCPEWLLRATGRALGKEAVIQRLCSSLVLDKRETSKVLGWHAPFSLDWGINRTAEWFLNWAAAR
jgi:UDP-4-keto-D-QuiNAc 4-reductase